MTDQKITIPDDPKKILIPLSVLVAVGGIAMFIAYQVVSTGVKWTTSLERNTEAQNRLESQMESLEEELDGSVLSRRDFQLWVERLRELNGSTVVVPSSF